jgi:diguanylate cyclase (GGDEF)-like protein/PAS domain S-box-containing protein
MRRLLAHRQFSDELRESEARYRTVLDAAFDAIVTITPDGLIRWFNRGAERTFGHRAEEAIGQPVTLLMPERYRELCVAGLHRYLRTGEARVVGGTIELVGLRKDGSEFPIEMSLGETHENGQRLFTGVIRDITERKRTEDALREARDRFRSVFDHAPIGVAVVSPEGRYLQVNRSLCEILGHSEEELLNTTWQEITHPEDLATSLAYARRIVEGKIPRYHLEKRYLHADGHTVWTSLSVSLVRDAEGGPLYFVSQIQDVTKRKEAERKLREAEQRYRTLVERVPAVVYIQEIGSPDSAMYMSPQIEVLTGYSPEECKDPDLRWGMVHPEDREWLQLEDELTGEPGEIFSTEYRVLHRHGRTKWVRNESVVIEDEMSGTRYWQGFMLDITERKALEQQMHHQAFHDPLTGLPNRALFMDRLKDASTRAHRQDSTVAVLFTDLDNFKVINDSLGHKAGDQLLVAVAGRLKAHLRPEDTAARLGGDEFTILAEDVTGVGDMIRMAEQIAEILRPPFALEGQEVFATVSTGIALSSPLQQPADLLRHADMAMYRAKHRGKARHEVFEPSMGRNASERLWLENELRRALERGEFRVYYQPIVALEDGRIVGAEALVRWEHPRRGLLVPGEFLSVAEDTGLIVQIGEWVLREACHQLRAWQQRYPTPRPLTVSVNLSPKQLFSPELVAEILEETGIDPGTLQLEITEGVMTSNDANSANNTLRSLKDLKIQLAVDDFGMGYSSLSYLKRFPVDFLKIDRSFIAGLGQDTDGPSKDAEIVPAMIDLTHALGLKAVAEGVETAEQLAQLRNMGCDFAQGNYFSEPLPSAELSDLLDSEPAN